MARHTVGPVDELPPGSVKIVTLGKRSIGVYNVAGAFHAINNFCPHQGGPLCLGPVTGVSVAEEPYEFRWVREGEIVRCPWHRWEVDITSGAVLTDPTLRVKRYEVRVEDGHVVLEA